MIRRPPKSPLFPSPPLFRSLHRQVGGFVAAQDAVDIGRRLPNRVDVVDPVGHETAGVDELTVDVDRRQPRSEEHTSELQSRSDLVCRLLLEKKKNLQHQQRNRGAVKRHARPLAPGAYIGNHAPYHLTPAWSLAPNYAHTLGAGSRLDLRCTP